MCISCIDWTIALSIISTIAAVSGVVVAILSSILVFNSQKAKIIISLKSEQNFCFLVVKNVGQNTAKGITFSVNDDLKNIMGVDLCKPFDGIISHPFTLLGGGDQKQVFILNFSDTAKAKSLSEIIITVKGEYIDTFLPSWLAQTKINETLKYFEFITNTTAMPNLTLNSINEIKSSVNMIKNKVIK